MADAAGERRARLVALATERGFVRVGDASDLLGVSEVTVRADLARLVHEGVLTRVHGGAVPAGAGRAEDAVERTVREDARAKRAIGVRAAALVEPGSSVLLDVGSTALAVAEALVAREDLSDVVVITNGLAVALALEPAHERMTVVVTGGTLRPLQHSLVDPLATTVLERVRADLAILGCNGVDAAAGVTNVNLPEAEVKRRMVAAAARTVVVADASKIGRVHLAAIARLDEVDALVTAGEGSSSARAELRAAGLEILDAPLPAAESTREV